MVTTAMPGDEESPLLNSKENPSKSPSPPHHPISALIGFIFVAASSLAVFGVSQAPFFHRAGQLDTVEEVSLHFYDRYNVKYGKPYYFGYDFVKTNNAQVVAVSQPTTVHASGLGDVSLTWVVTHPDGTIKEFSAGTSEIEIKFSSPGTGSVTVSSKDGKKSATKTLVVRYMRHEIRNLFDDDREAFFKALKTVYSVSTADGVNTYGSEYKGAEYFMEYHTWMAGTRECDHLHDGMGFLTGHNAITMEFEKNLRLIEPTTSVPFWDYTIDMHNVYLRDKEFKYFYASPMFQDDWFGPMGTKESENYAVESGWASEITVAPLDWKLDPSSVRVTNAYGLMRSPWNSGNDPRLLRSDLTLGYASEYTSAPRCSMFYEAMSYSDVLLFTKTAQANAHGAIHTFIGGVSHADWKTLMSSWGMSSDYALEISLQGFGPVKGFWRDGLLSCPESCDMSTPVEDCACSCPDFDTWDSEFIHHLVADHLNNFASAAWTSDSGEYLGAKMVALLCGQIPGYKAPFMGTAMDSGATADPTFWPTHPNVDRLFQWRRMLGMTGTKVWPDGDRTSSSFYWGAGHSADGCWGHQPDDTMIWKDLGFLDDTNLEGTYYTVKELWELMDANTGHLPYMYPDFSWEHCEEEGYPADLIYIGDVTDDDAPIVNG